MSRSALAAHPSSSSLSPTLQKSPWSFQSHQHPPQSFRRGSIEEKQHGRPRSPSSMLPKMFVNRPLIGAVVVLCLVFYLLYNQFPRPLPLPSNGKLQQQAEVGVSPRIAKITMLYGDPNELYDRAVKTHQLHGQKMGYPTHVLRHEITGGYWNKPSYILSLIIAELAKAPEDRVGWFMWVDADSIIINPKIPLEIFLPPFDYNHIHFLGNKDQNGLNTGTFFIRVCPWSVRMLSKAMAYPAFRPDVDLGYSADQMAMSLVFEEAEFKENVMYQPRPWYNTYEFHHAYEGKKGDMLVHFPGLFEARWAHMDKWLRTVENTPHEWELDVANTSYPKKIDEFWSEVRAGTTLLKQAEGLLEKEKEENKAKITAEIEKLKNGIQQETGILENFVKIREEVETMISTISGAAAVAVPEV